MTSHEGRDQLFDAERFHRLRRRRKVVSVAVAVITLVAVIGAFTWVYFSDGEPGDVAETLQVAIPSSATEHASTAEGAELKGNCADIEFLIPDAEWNAYVAQYFTADALRPRYGAETSCSGERTICDDIDYVHGQSSFEASDKITDGEESYTRTLAVVQHCKPGLTRISWRAIL